MNAYAVFVVNEHIEQLQREAVERRAARTERPSITTAIADAIGSIRSSLRTTDQTMYAVVPRLDGYPYRG